jgi:hypothetical protein
LCEVCREEVVVRSQAKPLRARSHQAARRAHRLSMAEAKLDPARARLSGVHPRARCMLLPQPLLRRIRSRLLSQQAATLDG